MGALGIDLGLLLSQAVNFVLLLFLLYVLLYRPLLAKLEERAARIRKGLDDAARAEQRLREAEAHYQAEIERARREAREIMERATRAAEQQQAEILSRARQEAHDLLLRAQQQVEREAQEREIMVAQQVIDLAMAAAGRLLREELDDEKHRDLVREFLHEAGQLDQT